jgi:Protein of unknown function (DUF2933)
MEIETRTSPRSSVSWLRSRTGIAFLVFLAVALYFLLTEHRAHVIQALPWLLVLLCPLMHLFHRGHGGHGQGGGGSSKAPSGGGAS